MRSANVFSLLLSFSLSFLFRLLMLFSVLSFSFVSVLSLVRPSSGSSVLLSSISLKSPVLFLIRLSLCNPRSSLLPHLARSPCPSLISPTHRHALFAFFTRFSPILPLHLIFSRSPTALCSSPTSRTIQTIQIDTSRRGRQGRARDGFSIIKLRQLVRR